LVSRASQENNRKEACLLEWQEILLLIGSASGLQSSLANSKYPRALLKKSLEKYTAGTLERYLAAAKQFLDFLGLSNLTVLTIDVAFLADFLHACERSLEEDRELCKIGTSAAPTAHKIFASSSEAFYWLYMEASDSVTYNGSASTAYPSPALAYEAAWIATESAMGMPVITDFILPVLTNLGGLHQAGPGDVGRKPSGPRKRHANTKALLVEKFANQAHSSSESEDEQVGARKSE
ncbi:unnamed protein product, partial [Symbiodinium necroappetens]